MVEVEDLLIKAMKGTLGTLLKRVFKLIVCALREKNIQVSVHKHIL